MPEIPGVLLHNELGNELAFGFGVAAWSIGQGLWIISYLNYFNS
jgi:hypothetical protein